MFDASNPVPASVDKDDAHATALAEVERAMHALLVPSFVGSVLPEMVAPALTSGGKRMRARLALTAGAALGGEPASHRAWACACELMHNATLVHDDLQDGDETRRGQPTVWVRHGAAQAINVGDYLFMAAFRALDALVAVDAARAGFALAQALAQGLGTVIEGQALECASADYYAKIAAFPYETMVRGKTAALFALPVYGSALLAGHAPNEARACSDAFAALGVLFQMQDDVLDLWGDKGRKLPAADLYEGKISCVVTAHLARRPQDAGWLGALLARPRNEVTAKEVEDALRAFTEAGTREAVLADMQARSALLQAACPAPLRDTMDGLVRRTWAPLQHLAPWPPPRRDGGVP